MTPQAKLCITTSPVHTVDYYAAIADEVIAAGAEEDLLEGYGRYRSACHVGCPHKGH